MASPKEKHAPNFRYERCYSPFLRPKQQFDALIGHKRYLAGRWRRVFFYTVLLNVFLLTCIAIEMGQGEQLWVRSSAEQDLTKNLYTLPKASPSLTQTVISEQGKKHHG